MTSHCRRGGHKRSHANRGGSTSNTNHCTKKLKATMYVFWTNGWTYMHNKKVVTWKTGIIFEVVIWRVLLSFNELFLTVSVRAALCWAHQRRWTVDIQHETQPDKCLRKGKTCCKFRGGRSNFRFGNIQSSCREDDIQVGLERGGM